MLRWQKETMDFPCLEICFVKGAKIYTIGNMIINKKYFKIGGLMIKHLAQKIIDQEKMIVELYDHIRQQDYAIKIMVAKIREYQARDNELRSGIKVKDGGLWV